VPRSVLYAIVRQPTTRVHHGITHAILQEADVVLHNPVALHPAHGVCQTDSDGGKTTIGGLLRRRAFPATRVLLRVDTRAVGQDESLEAHLLREIPAGGHARALPLSPDCIVGLPVIGSPQAANLTGVIQHQEGVDRLACLVAAGVCLVVCWIGRAVDRSLRPLMPPRGDVGPSWVWVLGRRVAHSAAVRAGRSSGCPHAWCSPGWRRGIHALAGAGLSPTSCPCMSCMGCCGTEVTLKSPLSAIVGKGAVSYVL
jgi:hypothetical protein